MPTYEYRCKDCGHEFETVQAFSDEPLTACPSCTGPLRKVFGNVGISFKGSGFYKTDSQSGSSRSSTADSSDTTSKPATTTSSTDSASSSSSSSGSSPGSDSSSSSSTSTATPAST